MESEESNHILWFLQSFYSDNLSTQNSTERSWKSKAKCHENTACFFVDVRNNQINLRPGEVQYLHNRELDGLHRVGFVLL